MDDVGIIPYFIENGGSKPPPYGYENYYLLSNPHLFTPIRLPSVAVSRFKAMNFRSGVAKFGGHSADKFGCFCCNKANL